jgi:hypothetical protein
MPFFQEKEKEIDQENFHKLMDPSKDLMQEALISFLDIQVKPGTVAGYDPAILSYVLKPKVSWP